MKLDGDTIGPMIGVGFFVLFFGCMIISMFGDMIFRFDFAPASGTTTGYISFQEKSGIYGLDMVCWRDTPYSDCEVFDPKGQTFEPGRYKMSYECTRFVWAWEASSECWIVNATRIGEIPAN
jgi:hypothetical protein